MNNRLFLVLTLIVASLTTLRSQGAEPTRGIAFDKSCVYCAELPKGSVKLRQFTVAAWVKPTQTDDSLGFMSVGAPSEYFTFYTFRGATRMLVENKRDERTYSFALGPLPKRDVWTHYVGTYDGETIKLYCNGKLAGAKTSATETHDDALDGAALILGAAAPNGDRHFLGEMTELALWNRALSDADVATLYEQGADKLIDGRVALWNAASVSDDRATLTSKSHGDAPTIVAQRFGARDLLNQKDSGYRGLWYYNQKLDNEYVYKYSGGLGTYCANHYPFSVYRPEVDKTFFCYGGTDPDEKTLWHEVGVYDHKTKKVSRPTIILDKKTDDAHDNPVISVDADGYVWIFSTSHGVPRPSFIHKSVRPYDVSEFERVDATKLVDGARVPMTNFSYLQIWNAPERGFVAFFTTYDRKLVADVAPDSKAQRILAFMTSPNGVEWSAWRPLAAIEIGHYQNSRVYVEPGKTAPDGKPAVKLGTAFNYHPATPKGARGVGLNWRTNIYYMESTDFGATWHTITNEPLEIPLLTSNSPALVRDYEAENLNVYITDLNYDAQGRPMIAYVTSKGFESGPEMGPREFCVARWTGEAWEYSKVTEVDNNYEYAMLYLEDAANGTLRLVGSFEDGPQAYNTGGEISQWISRDGGATWNKEFQLTRESDVNQCFPRRTVDASPEFYAIWAEGNGRRPSSSEIRFSTKDGAVYELPREMKEDWEAPILVRQADEE